MIYSRTTLLFGLILWIASLVSPLYGRNWTDRTGKFQVEAEFVALVGAAVQLKLGDGKVISVPLNKLSAADQQHVRELIKRPPAAVAEKTAATGEKNAVARPYWPDPKLDLSNQQFEFTPFAAKDLGIPELAGGFNKIHDIAGTPDGSIWFATKDGVGQWREDEKSYSQPFPDAKAPIERLLVSADDVLWAVSSQAGVARRTSDGSWESFLFPDEFKSDRMFAINQLQSLAMTPGGTLWLKTRLPGLLRFADGKWEQTLVEESQRDFLSFLNMQADAEGTIWSVIGGRGLLRFDGQKYEFAPNTPTSQPGAMALSPDGKLLIAFAPNLNLRTKTAEGGGLWVIDNGKPKLLDKDNSALPLNTISALAYAPDGALWVGLENQGIARLGSKQAQHFVAEVNQPASNTVRRLTITPDGNVWIFAKFMLRARPVSP